MAKIQAKEHPLPWLSLACMGLGYALLGWHLSAYHYAWVLGSWILAILFSLALIWGGKFLEAMIRFGPRSVVTMFVLSASVTLAVASSTLFAMIAILLASKTLARVELQANGFSPRFTLFILFSVSGLALTGGWLIGELLFPSSPFWLSFSGSNS